MSDQWVPWAALVVSLLALCFSGVSAFSAYRSSMASKTNTDPFVVVDIAQYDHSEQGIPMVTLRNKGGSAAKNVRLTLFTSENYDKSSKKLKTGARYFWTDKDGIEYIEKDGHFDLGFPSHFQYSPSDMPSFERQMFFKNAVALVSYESRSGHKLQTLMKLRPNKDPSAVVIEVLGRSHKRTHDIIANAQRNRGEESEPYQPLDASGIATSTLIMVVPPGGFSSREPSEEGE